MKRCLSKPPVGFTLVELLMVIAIIGLLMMILVPAVHTARLQGEVAKAQVRVTELAGACNLYHQDTGYYPGQAEPGKLLGTPTSPAPHYTGSQYLAMILLVHGGAEFTSGDFLDDGPDDDLSTGGTISDRTSKGMAILYFPARLAETGLDQFKRDDNDIYWPADDNDPKHISLDEFREYIWNPALPLDNETPERKPFADGKFIIVAPDYKGEYFTGGPTYPGL